jgi:hypothetical protein
MVNCGIGRASEGLNMAALEFLAVNVPQNTELLQGLERQNIDSILAAAVFPSAHRAGPIQCSRLTTLQVFQLR